MTDLFGKELKVGDKVITFEMTVNDTELNTGTIVKIENHDGLYYWAEIMVTFVLGGEEFHRYVWRKSNGIVILNDYPQKVQ